MGEDSEGRDPGGGPLRRWLRRFAREIGKFGAVGAVGFAVNVVVFNLCIHTLGLAPIRSGVLAQVIAIGTNYVGNRYWTYSRADKDRVRRETLLFFLFSGAGLVLENSVLALSHYGLGYTSALADNIAKNGIGLALGTVFRFWAYRTWVFVPPEQPATAAQRPRPAAYAARGAASDRAVTGDDAAA